MEINSFDIETIRINGSLKPIIISFTKGDKVFSKISLSKGSGDDLLKYFLKNIDRSSVYYAHNLTFDVLVLLPYITKLDFKIKSVIHNYTIYSLTLITGGGEEVRFRCSFKLTSLSLKELGSLSELPKLPYPTNLFNSSFRKYRSIYPFHFKSVEEFIEFGIAFKNCFSIKENKFDMERVLLKYCETDAIITRIGVINFLSNLSFNIRGLSPLSASGVALLSAIKTSKKLKPSYNNDVDYIIRKAYYGGRCEVFGNSRDYETALHFDFKGMYAQCMEESLPYGNCRIVNNIGNIVEPGFYLIRFSQKGDIPVLPTRSDFRLKFGNGIMEGWFWFEEIKLAVSNGTKIIEILSSILFDGYSPILSEFVHSNNRIRGKGGIHSAIGKNNNNLLYGRLGMGLEDTEFKIVSKGGATNYDVAWEFNNYLIVKGFSKTKRPFTNVAIAAAITSKARIKLFNGFKVVEKNGGRILYCDTDSIIAAFCNNEVNNVIGRNLGLGVCFDPTTIGTVLTDSLFALPKAYSIKYIDVSGREIEKTKIKSLKNIKNRHNYFKSCFFFKKLFKWNQIIMYRLGFRLNIKKVNYRIQLHTLSKRVWDDDWYTTKPLSIS